MEAFNYRDINHRIADSFFLDSLVQIRLVSLIINDGKRKKSWRCSVGRIDLVIGRGFGIRCFGKIQHIVSLLINL